MEPPKQAILLSAGLGTRMRPLTLTLPKPLVPINGRTLLDRALDTLECAGVEEVVVNVHHLADQIEEHVKKRQNPKIILSDERETLLDSAGGIVKALPFIKSRAFYVLNSDTFWIDEGQHALHQLSQAFDPAKMDMMLLIVRRNQTSSPEKGDFLMNGQGQLVRASTGHEDAVIYAGALITTPDIFSEAKVEPHSLNSYFDRAIAQKRLYGLALQGSWYTVGTVEMIEIVEKMLAKREKIL